MKYCSRCGREMLDEAVICIGCGCAAEKKEETDIVKYQACLEGAIGFLIIAVIITVVGIALRYSSHKFITAGIICFFSSFILYIPDFRLLLEYKRNGLSLISSEARTIRKRLSSTNIYVTISPIISFINSFFGSCFISTGIMIFSFKQGGYYFAVRILEEKGLIGLIDILKYL